MNDARQQLPEDTSPMNVLLSILSQDDTPQVVKDFVNDKLAEILLLEIPKMGVIAEHGPVRLITKQCEVTGIYETAMEYARTEDPDMYSKVSATVRDVGQDLAERIDAGMRRILLDDAYLNTAAHVELLSAHAKLVAMLENLKLDETQIEWAEKNVEQADA